MYWKWVENPRTIFHEFAQRFFHIFTIIPHKLYNLTISRFFLLLLCFFKRCHFQPRFFLPFVCLFFFLLYFCSILILLFILSPGTCGGPCCNRATEETLRQQARADFHSLIHHHSRSLQGLLATTADALRGKYKYLSF